MSDRTHSRRTVAMLIGMALITQGCVSSSMVATMGDEEAEKVEQAMGLIHEKKPSDYVVELGRKLAALSELPGGPWTFQIVDTPEPNAFALPGGHIYVSRGLLALVNSEDELAGVISHEIGHVTERHSEKRIRATLATSPISIATGIGGAAAGIVSRRLGNLVAGSGRLISASVVAPYSRSQENEADKVGQGLAARAGYTPSGISTFLHTLGREQKLVSGDERESSFLDTHPMTPERVARTKKTASSLVRAAGSPIARDRADLLSRIEGVVVGNDPAQGIFQGQLFLHPELDIEINFPEAWETVNTRDAVGAVNSSEDAVVSFRIADSDTTLERVIKGLDEEQSGLVFERFKVAGLPAANTVISGRDQVSNVTLIEYRRNVYVVMGQTKTANAARYAKSFDATARSFRALRISKRNSIEESRLRTRTAQTGENPAGISKRTGSTWSPAEFAVANGIEVDTALEGGQPLKAAIPQAYTPRKH
jgi:predicted Zn-dependent protease